MNKKDKSSATTPFFARYLEGQSASDQPSAEIRSGKSIGYVKAGAKPPLQTLKFPSDSDELNYVPCYRSAKDIPEKYREKLVTLKFPSDSDEHKYEATYVAKADVPKGKPKSGGKVQLKKK
ncbi:MAG: microviridin/marinostatin family tricyclic proteinase inhibitor [Pyrinomonadaceae bacterium]